MPYRKISRDLKLAAMNLYDRELVSLDDILDCVGFSERTFSMYSDYGGKLATLSNIQMDYVVDLAFLFLMIFNIFCALSVTVQTGFSTN
jgi:hypothetical protein